MAYKDSELGTVLVSAQETEREDPVNVTPSTHKIIYITSPLTKRNSSPSYLAMRTYLVAVKYYELGFNKTHKRP